MKAVWFEKFGPAKEVLQYGEISKPTPREGEVLVRLHRSAVNPSDVKKRAGASPTLLNNGPVIPNSDGSGIIEEIGAGIDPTVVNQRVWVYNGQFQRNHGTSAEYISIPRSQAVYLPDKVSYDVGACMGIPAMTAHRCVTINGPIHNQLVLVTGGAGRVGYYAIQIAKLLGATVIATAGSQSSRAHCKEAGADFVTSHPGPETTKEIIEFTQGRKIDRIVDGDFGINLPHNLDILKTSGVITTYSSMSVAEPSIPFRRMMFMDLNIHLVIVYAMPEEAKVQAKRDITEWLKEEKLHHRIEATFPLEDSFLAHEAIESGKPKGCVLLDMGTKAT